jgi:hypothetical protein
MVLSFLFQASSFKAESSARPGAGIFATNATLKPAGGANRAQDDEFLRSSSNKSHNAFNCAKLNAT